MARNINIYLMSPIMIILKVMPSSAFPDSNQRLTVGLKPPGKAFAQHAIESVVPSGLRPTRLQYVWNFRCLKAVPKKI